MNNRRLTLPAAMALALAVPSAYAMGLGQMQVKSGLNQPLVAEIPIISASPDELAKLDVRLASPEAFARVGLERPYDLTANLQFSIGKNASGLPIIRVSTPGKFVEPMLSFLIEADWGQGRITREYTALIDPPYIKAAEIQPMQAPTTETAAVPAPVVEPPLAETMPAPETEAGVTSSEPLPLAPEPIAATPEPAPEAQQDYPPAPPEPAPMSEPIAEAAPAPKAVAGDQRPVSYGDTLWEIARSVRPDASVSVNQMMLALLRANPEAFNQDNINRLKSGSVLRIPSQDEAVSLSTSAATALVHQQNLAWRAWRQPVPQPAESLAEQGPLPRSPKPAAAPIASNNASAKAGSRLEIVPPSGKANASGAQSGAAVGAGGSELRAELLQVREDLATRDAEVSELRSRLADIEQEDAKRQQLLELKNSRLNELTVRLNQIEAQKAATTNSTAAVSSTAAVRQPWYLNLYFIAGGLLVLVGGMVLAMRAHKSGSGRTPRRLSDDEALRASMAQTRNVITPVAAVAAATTASAAPPADLQLPSLQAAVDAHPKDLEAHLNLLRHLYANNNVSAYEDAAEAMREQVNSTLDPRWREAVIMGSALIPESTLFSQTGWNSPRFGGSGSDNVSDDHEMPVATETSNSKRSATAAEVDPSTTRIQLAKAYLDMGDLEGARGMLEEVLGEGDALAKAEAKRILRENG